MMFVQIQSMRIFFLIGFLNIWISIVFGKQISFLTNKNLSVCVALSNSINNKLELNGISMYPNDGCDMFNFPSHPNIHTNIRDFHSIIMAVKRGNCNLGQKMTNVYTKYGINNLLVVSPSYLSFQKFLENIPSFRFNVESFVNTDNNNYNNSHLKITSNSKNKANANIFFIRETDFKLIFPEALETNNSYQDSPLVTTFSIEPLKLAKDMGPLLLAFIIILISIVGAYMGGRTYFQKFKDFSRHPSNTCSNINHLQAMPNKIMTIDNIHNKNDENVDKNLDKTHKVVKGQKMTATNTNKAAQKVVDENAFSITTVLFMVLFMTVFMMLVWYFFKYAVYYLIYVFFVYSTLSLYMQLKSVFALLCPFADIRFFPYHHQTGQLPQNYIDSHNINTNKYEPFPASNELDNQIVGKTIENASTKAQNSSSHQSNVPQNSADCCFIHYGKRLMNYITDNFLALLTEICTVKNTLSLITALLITCTWLILRHEFYAFIFQDIMGASLCIYILSTIHIPNLKVGTLLLSLLFVFDIFFVFITPLITKSKTSIMLDILGGKDTLPKQTSVDLGSLFRVTNTDSHITASTTFNSLTAKYDALNNTPFSQRHLLPQKHVDNSTSIFSPTKIEQIPLAFRMPYISWMLIKRIPAIPCAHEYLLYEFATQVSYVGYGDVVMPGLLMAFCFFFDRYKSAMLHKKVKIYSTMVSLAYILGLLSTYGALYLMQRAQLALLYLVPFTLGTTALTALFRGELSEVWNFNIHDPKYHTETMSVSPLN